MLFPKKNIYIMLWEYESHQNPLEIVYLFISNQPDYVQTASSVSPIMTVGPMSVWCSKPSLCESASWMCHLQLRLGLGQCLYQSSVLKAFTMFCWVYFTFVQFSGELRIYIGSYTLWIMVAASPALSSTKLPRLSLIPWASCSGPSDLKYRFL